MSDKKSAPYRLRLWLFIAVAITVMGGIGGLYLWRNDPILDLRKFASDIREFNGPLNFTGDYQRLIRAKCSKEDFQKFAKREGLSKIAATARLTGDGGDWVWSTGPDWWNPPDSIIGSYVEFNWPPHHHGTIRLLTYKDGFLYYECQRW